MSGMTQPSQMTIDPLQGTGGRGLANGIFDRLRMGGGSQGGSLQPGQAPAFDQLFGGGGGGGGSPFGGASNGSHMNTGAGAVPSLPGTNPMARRGPMSGKPNGGGTVGGQVTSGTRMGSSVNGGNFQVGDGQTFLGGPGTTMNAVQPLPMTGNGLMDGVISQFNNGMTNAQGRAAGNQALLEGSFDLPGWGGPMGAGLTGGQLDALSGFDQIVRGNANPLVNNGMIQDALATGLGGNRAFDPNGGQTLEEATSPFELPSQTGTIFDRILGGANGGAGGAGAGGGSRLNSIVDQITPELVDSFTTALQPPGAATGQGTAAMNGAIDLAMARANEQASSFGLTPGSIDRNQLMAGAAAQTAADLGVAQQNADTNAISRQNMDRVGAINSAGQFENLLNSDFRNWMSESGLAASILPAMQDQENMGWERMFQNNEAGAGRTQDTLSQLPEFRNIPLNELGAMFGINDAARGVADEQITRAIGEFGRTQGGGLGQMLGALGAIPGVNTAMGPSTLSQIGGLAGGVGQAAGGLKSPGG